MNPFEMVIMIVAIGCATAVVGQVIDAAKAYLVLRAKRGSIDPELQQTLRAVREEMAQLRQSSHDVVLTFDATLQRLDARLRHVEQQGLATGRPAVALPSAPPARAATDEAPARVSAR